jgi:iron complex transport system substrate-binding protein
MTSHLPSRIVSLQPSATVILHALGLLDLVVACTKYCLDVCPEAASGRRLVADSWTAKAAEILAAKPDLVIAAVPYQERAVSEILRSGVRFLGLAPHTLADIYGDIVTIAGITGSSQPGERLVKEMQRGIDEVREATRLLERRTVFCEEWGNPIIASQLWVAELVAAAGGQFVGDPGKQIDPEAIRTADPNVLVAAWCGAGDRVPLEKIVRSRTWTEMNAVRQRRVYCIPDEWLNTPAPTLLQGLRSLAAAIHPERFSPPARLRRLSDVSAAMSDQAPAV